MNKPKISYPKKKTKITTMAMHQPTMNNPINNPTNEQIKSKT